MPSCSSKWNSAIARRSLIFMGCRPSRRTGFYIFPLLPLIWLPSRPVWKATRKPDPVAVQAAGRSGTSRHLSAPVPGLRPGIQLGLWRLYGINCLFWIRSSSFTCKDGYRDHIYEQTYIDKLTEISILTPMPGSGTTINENIRLVADIFI